MSISEMRTLTGLSQKKFGDLLGIPMRTIQDWEGGKAKPPSYVIMLIEYYLKSEKKI